MWTLLITTALAQSYVLVPAEAWVHTAPDPEAPGARRATEAAPHDVSVAEELERVDGWVHIRTLPVPLEGVHCHPRLETPSLALEGWVQVDALASVLTQELSLVSGDAALTIQPGQRVLAGEPAVLPSFGWSIAITTLDAAVGDHYSPSPRPELTPLEGEVRRAKPGTVLRAPDDNFVFTPSETLGLREHDGVVRYQDVSACVQVAGQADGPLVVGAAGLVGGPLAPPVDAGWVLPAGTALVRPDGTPAGTVVEDWRVAEDRVTSHSEFACVEVALGRSGEGVLPVCAPREAAPPAEAEPAGPVQLSHKQVTVTRHSQPPYPSGAKDAEAICKVRVVMSDAGRPVEVEASDCRDIFASAAENAVRRWRWKPPPIEAGQQAEIMVGVRFQRR